MIKIIQKYHLENNDVNLIKEYLLKLVLTYFWYEIDENIKSKGKIKYLKEQLPKMRLKLADNITNIINDLVTSTKEISFKFRLYRATMFNILSIIKNKEEFDCLKIISEYNQAIINIKQSKNDNPYEAINFLKNIADNLNEDSCFFDLLLQ